MYKKWSIIDLFDYLVEFYKDNAQTNPSVYGARYDGANPSDYPDQAEEITAWRATHATQIDGVWYWINAGGNIVDKFTNLIFMWRQDIVNDNLFAKNYVYVQRNHYIISAEAWRIILRERYADFKFLTSYEYDYKTKTRHYYDTIEEATEKLYETLRVFEHDKLDALTKLMVALRKNYDPTENYNRYGEIDLHLKGSETINYKPTGSESTTFEKGGSETNTTTLSGKEKVTDINGEQTNVHSKIPYDGTEWKNTDKDNSQQFTNSSEKEFGSSGSNRQDQNVLSFTNRIDTTTKEFANTREDDTWTQYGKTPDGSTDERHNITTEHIHGNIGVTTTQQMIESQFPIEYYDEIEHYTVSEFVHKYLVIA